MNFIHRLCFEVCNDFDNTLCSFWLIKKIADFFFYMFRSDEGERLSKHAFMSISKCNGIYISLEPCGLLL